MMLYWMETAIIGFWHILRMILSVKWPALFLGPFFCVHFGGFMVGHFVFLWSIFSGPWKARVHGPWDFFSQVVMGTGLWIPLIALFISHGVSFYLNFLKKSDILDASSAPPVMTVPNLDAKAPPFLRPLATPKGALAIQDLMLAPYRRVIVMHVTIIFGALLSQVFKTGKAAFILLIVLKTAADFASHARKNFRPAPPPSKAPVP